LLRASVTNASPSLGAGSIKPPRGKAQQRFRKLVATIERKREELRGWQAYRQRYNQRVATEFEVVRLELRQQQRQMAVLIDELLSQRGQRRRLSRVGARSSGTC
jgi:hypothetical protein